MRKSCFLFYIYKRSVIKLGSEQPDDSFGVTFDTFRLLSRIYLRIYQQRVTQIVSVQKRRNQLYDP